MHRILALFIVLPCALFAQTDKKQDVWAPFKFFVGAWEGTGTGQSGISKVEREYQFALNGKFLQARNKSIYEPQEKNPKGEMHEDWGLFSYDRNRKKFVLRQFHVEGFVNQFVLDSLAADGKTLVFVTESIENIAPGWRAKETYKVLNDDELVEIFELAGPGQNFELYSESHLKRKK
jgi:hypothetical protein